MRFSTLITRALDDEVAKAKDVRPEPTQRRRTDPALPASIINGRRRARKPPGRTRALFLARTQSTVRSAGLACSSTSIYS